MAKKPKKDESMADMILGPGNYRLSDDTYAKIDYIKGNFAYGTTDNGAVAGVWNVKTGAHHNSGSLDLDIVGANGTLAGTVFVIQNPKTGLAEYSNAQIFDWKVLAKVPWVEGEGL